MVLSKSKLFFSGAFFLSLCLVGIIFCFRSFLVEDGIVDYSLTVVAKQQGNESYLLDIVFTNTSTKAIKMNDSEFPWRTHSLILFPIDTVVAEGKPVPTMGIIDDLGWSTTTIEPGQTVQGRINLTGRFPSLAKIMKTRDVVVFWSYQPKLSNGTRGKRTGGWLLLSEADEK